MNWAMTTKKTLIGTGGALLAALVITAAKPAEARAASRVHVDVHLGGMAAPFVAQPSVVYHRPPPRGWHPATTSARLAATLAARIALFRGRPASWRIA